MAYIGNTVQNQGFTPAIDYFNGNGVTVTFTLSRPVVSVAQMIVAIDNVIQNPSTAFTVSGNSITFTSAPLSGSNNIWVEYTSLITQYNAISQDPSVIGDITATGGYLATGDFGNTFTDGTIVDYVTGMSRITTGSATGMTFYNGGPSARNALMTLASTGNVGIGTTSPTTPLTVNGQVASVGASSIYGIYRRDTNAYAGGWYSAAGTITLDTLVGAAVNIDSSGRVTMPFQPAFEVRGSGTQSWSGAAAYQVLVLDTKTGSIPSVRSAGYNTSTYRFTAPVAGTYAFYYGWAVTSAATGPEGTLFLNNSSVFRNGAIGYTYTGGYFTATGFQTAYLNANDFVNLQIVNNNSVSFTLDTVRSFFGGYLLG
jgi:hypothetical protein